jgi:hypothetical protein
MSTAKWSALGTSSGNIAGTTLNALANGASSAFVTYDNSTALDLYAAVAITLGSFTSVAPASLTLRVHFVAGGVTPDDTGSVGGGETYTVPLTTGASAKNIVIPMVRLYPGSMRLQITNNAGAAFVSTGNTLAVIPYDESIA